MRILIKNNQTGIVREYGQDEHDSLNISHDGSYLYYENLQNGHDSLGGGYSFVMESGKTPKESKAADAINSACDFDIGDFKWRPQGEWIPVSERLPEYSGLYLISVDDLVTVADFTGAHFMNRVADRVEVDAWMPLVEPYKPYKKGSAE